MGLLQEGINEVIATTWLNAAPMGIIHRGEEYRMVLFRGSHTAMNIERWGWVVANILHDPVLLVRTAFSDLPATAFIEEEVEGFLVHRLPAAEAWVAFDAAIEHRARESLTASLSPMKEVVVSPVVHPVNRGYNSVIEAAVHGTRYLWNKDPGLRGLIDHHRALIRRCGGPRELEALELLEGYLEVGKSPASGESPSRKND
ncbi:MAG TPA: DUF447 domain-containing protein [Methanomicrobiales archaeon]|nr:DUF447 domain-containing protein [Methanomicrobiales archaeon]